MTPQPLDLSVVVVAYRTPVSRLDSIVRTFGQAAARSGATVEVVVVANDGAERYADVEGCVLIDPGVNLGFAAGTRAGLERSRGGRVLFANPDCIFDADSAAALIRLPVAPMEVVSPVLVDETGRPDTGPFTSWVCSLDRRVNLRRGRRFVAGAAAPAGGAPAAAPTDATPAPEVLPAGLKLPGACVLLDRTTALRLGPFDPAYFLYGEDRDLCRRVRRAGGRLRLDRSFQVVHVGGESGAGAALFVRLAQLDAEVRFAFRVLGPVGALLAVVDQLARSFARPRVEVPEFLYAARWTARRWVGRRTEAPALDAALLERVAAR